jgi:uncharacterized protein YecE (DUF72 family)
MRAWIGTSGYSFKPWKGPFYPADLPDKKMLEYYASQLAAVEINNTFYSLPRASAVEGWAAQTPDAGFRFAVKASQKITHWKRLAGAEEETRYLLSTIRPLGERLGCVLYQLPPNMKLDRDRLVTFLDLLASESPDLRAAFEFRHASWAIPEVLDLLGSRGAAWVLAETDEEPLQVLSSGADWGYLRLRKEDYDAAALDAWAARIPQLGWREVFVFFKHEDEGKGPLLARDFVRRLAAASS